MSRPDHLPFSDVDPALAGAAAEVVGLATADDDVSTHVGSFHVWFAVSDGVKTKSGKVTVPADRADPAGEGWRSLQIVAPTARYRALAWHGELDHQGAAHSVVYVEVHERGEPTAARFAQRYERDGGVLRPVDAPVRCEPVEPAAFTDTARTGVTVVAPDTGIDEFADGTRMAVRTLVESLGADADAFERDPLTFAPALDDFVQSLPIDEMADDDWWWLHTVLGGFLAEVLIRGRGGKWTITPDFNAPRGYRYVVATDGPDDKVRLVDVYQVAHEALRPVPQRIPYVVERVLDAVDR